MSDACYRQVLVSTLERSESLLQRLFLKSRSTASGMKGTLQQRPCEGWAALLCKYSACVLYPPNALLVDYL